ncbi:MAG: hypothetical protein R3C53_11775 [Pirellulaceae bacterium]
MLKNWSVNGDAMMGRSMAERELGPMQFVDRLVSQGVALAIIGGHAVNFHGYVRATEDIDIVFQRDPQTEHVLYATLVEFGAYWIGDEIDPQTGLERTYPITLDYFRQQHLLMLGTSFGYLDLFDFLPGLEYESLEEFLASAQRDQHGRPFANLTWLKRLKAAANRPQDQIDLEHLG